MDDVLVPLAVAAGVAVVLVLVVALFVLRRVVLMRQVGAFDCSMRAALGRRGPSWVLGVARYRGNELDWFRAFGVSVRPCRSLRRNALAVLGTRRPAGGESFAVMPGAVVVQCLHAGVPVELAMTRDAVTGFSSWLEAAPPGQNVDVA